MLSIQNYRLDHASAKMEISKSEMAFAKVISFSMLFSLKGCHIDCGTCFGPKNNECLSCSNENLTVNAQGMCTCPEATYRLVDNFDEMCIACSEGCKTCNDNTTC